MVEVGQKIKNVNSQCLKTGCPGTDILAGAAALVPGQTYNELTYTSPVSLACSTDQKLKNEEDTVERQQALTDDYRKIN
uniref:Uncharacterized protein n=1 Tax=Romanomermis culicivorax TaxID=13658 RepID=A0A915HGH2_ROMCU